HAFQRWACTELFQCRARGPAAGRARTAYRARHRLARAVRRYARGGAGNEAPHRGRGPVIYGVGTDLIEIKRVARVLERFGERFARRILCEPELKRFRAHKQPVAY